MSAYSLGYAFVSNFFARPALMLFYRNVFVLHAKQVPGKGPVIFAPNHQNALMDALCILLTKNRQPVFVARADIFQKPIIIKILHFLRILPIYRKRDGVETSDNNQETFDILLKVLQHDRAVGIMPEGTHNKTKHLRVLQKGVFRFAMQAQEKYGDHPGVKIIPVGLEYSDTRKFRSDVLVNYGVAIEMSDYYQLYTENPNRCFKVLQDTLSEKMKAGMIDIENETYYDEIERIRVLYADKAMRKLNLPRNAENQLRAQQKIIASLQDLTKENPTMMDVLCGQIKEYVAILEKHNYRDWVVARQPYHLGGLVFRSLFSLIGIPFWLLGMLFNYVPYKLSDISSRKVKDPQFVSSVQFVAGMVLFPLYHLVMIILFAVFIPCIWGKFLMAILLIPFGLFAFKYYLSMKKLCARFRFWNAQKKNEPDILRAIDLRDKIFQSMDEIVM